MDKYQRFDLLKENLVRHRTLRIPSSSESLKSGTQGGGSWFKLSTTKKRNLIRFTVNDNASFATEIFVNDEYGITLETALAVLSLWRRKTGRLASGATRMHSTRTSSCQPLCIPVYDKSKEKAKDKNKQQRRPHR